MVVYIFRAESVVEKIYNVVDILVYDGESAKVTVCDNEGVNTNKVITNYHFISVSNW